MPAIARPRPIRKPPRAGARTDEHRPLHSVRSGACRRARASRRLRLARAPLRRRRAGARSAGAAAPFRRRSRADRRQAPPGAAAARCNRSSRPSRQRQRHRDRARHRAAASGSGIRRDGRGNEAMRRPHPVRLFPAAALAALLVLLLVEPAAAQSVTLDLGEGGSATGRIIQLLALITVLSLAPAILVTVTSFTRIIIVLSFLRNALGIQQTPPNTVLVSLALFLTAFVMAPTLQASYRDGLEPLMAEKITETQAAERAMAPLHAFMMQHVRAQDLQLFADMAKVDKVADAKDTPLRVLVPSFMISELRRAFEIGFLLFLPFLIIDMVVASILMSMGMMMLPPVTISLPFKIIFFVLVDGWYLVAGSLVQSFGPGG